MPDQELAFTRYFADLPDPRANRTQRHTKKHSLHDILGVTLCAVICCKLRSRSAAPAGVAGTS